MKVKLSKKDITRPLNEVPQDSGWWQIMDGNFKGRVGRRIDNLFIFGDYNLIRDINTPRGIQARKLSPGEVLIINGETSEVTLSVKQDFQGVSLDKISTDRYYLVIGGGLAMGRIGKRIGNHFELIDNGRIEITIDYVRVRPLISGEVITIEI